MTLQQMGYTLIRHYSRWAIHGHDITADGLHTDTTLQQIGYTVTTLQHMGYIPTRYYSRWATRGHDITADELHPDTT
jgi:hypothetical protein